MLRLSVCLTLVTFTLCDPFTLSQDARQKFLDVHNQYRKETGVEMPDLKWTKVLEEAAVEVGAPCEFTHPQDDFHYGENIFITSKKISDSYTDVDVAKDAAAAWHTEINNVNADGLWDCIANNPTKGCGHYSQEVWAGTTELGCSINTNCDIWGMKWTLVFCEYNPQGNAMDKYDFDKGKWVAKKPYNGRK